jgi:RimJ/RimL family protein N-acetyltransferase
MPMSGHVVLPARREIPLRVAGIGCAYVLRYWDAPPWSERLRAERFITACRQMAQEGTGARLAVDRVSDGAFIGWCSLKRWNPDYRSASLG